MLAAKKITQLHKYVVVGIDKAGKSTLLNKLIGKKVLITNEKRATAIKWAVKFHDSEKFLLKVCRNT
jgi:GTPase Era involved in 16S rRNA processing